MSVTAFAVDHASEFSIDERVVNWWYHYYSYGRGKKIANPQPVDFTVALYKRTPHFAEWKYDYRSCHPQIGATVTPGKSIVLVKTSIGRRRPEQGHLPPTAFVVGYFRVRAKDERWLYMDPEDSMLLLDDPILIDQDWAQTLLPGKRERYWDDRSQICARIGFSTRNKHVDARAVESALSELRSRKRKGSQNYLGDLYAHLVKKRDGFRLDDWR